MSRDKGETRRKGQKEVDDDDDGKYFHKYRIEAAAWEKKPARVRPHWSRNTNNAAAAVTTFSHVKTSLLLAPPQSSTRLYMSSRYASLQCVHVLCIYLATRYPKLAHRQPSIQLLSSHDQLFPYAYLETVPVCMLLAPFKDLGENETSACFEIIRQCSVTWHGSRARCLEYPTF